jgi:hypothetical protein
MGIGGQRKITSARGETVDFDLLMIKQQLAAAPQNIEVARRQTFIDNKEQGKSTRKKPVIEENQPLPVVKPAASSDEFENSNGDIPVDAKKSVTPEPVIERPAKK